VGRRLAAGALVTIVLCAAGCSNSTGSSATTGGPGGTTSSTTSFAAGSPWTGTLVPVALPAPVNATVATTCATATDCWAVGSTVGSDGAPNGAAVIATTNGGTSWVAQAIPATVGFLSAIACSTARQCVAAGQGQATQGVVITTTNGGTTWTQGALPAGVTDVTAVECQAGVQCMAIGSTASGDVALTSTSAGAPWTQVGALPAAVGGVRSIACVGATDCWVTGYTLTDADHVSGVVLQTTTGGTTWLALPLPVVAGYLNGVSCVVGPDDAAGTIPASTVPIAAPATVPTGGAGSATTTTVVPTGTSTTTSTTAPAPATSSTAPAPPGAGDAGVRCTVVGTTADTVVGVRSGHALVLTTANGGATWAAPTVTTTAASLLGVSCTADATCVSVGNTVLSTPQAGLIVFTGPTDRAWSRSSVVLTPQSLTGVDCVSTSRCVVVGESLTEHLAGS
jgi:hypothetical protein